MSEWPVFHIIGTPPGLRMAAGQALRALHVEDHGGAAVAREHVAREQHELAVGVDDLPVLRDDAQAVAVAVEGQAELGIRGTSRARCSSARFSGLLGSGWWLGKSPSTSQYSSIDLAAQRAQHRRRAGARRCRCRESTTIFIGRAQLRVAGDAVRVLGHDVHLRAAAALLHVVLGLDALRAASGCPRRRWRARPAPS
jgi:hypothetical protein